MISLLLIVLAVMVVIVIAIYNTFLIPPENFPKNIPTVPFYVTLLPFFKDVDQAELYRQYMEDSMNKYGVVKIFFGARWNILVGGAPLLQEIFRNEDIYQKSGNDQKIPYSVLAEYTGNNIISARGYTWKKFAHIMKPGLQRTFELEPLIQNTMTLVQLLRDDQRRKGTGSGVVVGPLLQRYSLANLSKSLLATDFGILETPDAPFHKLQMAVKQEIFKPAFLNFPILDCLPIPSRVRARALVRRFAAELAAVVQKSHEDVTCSLESDQLGQRLIAARQSGLLTELQFRDNLAITFVAGHENPQVMMVSTLYLLAKQPVNPPPRIPDQATAELTPHTPRPSKPNCEPKSSLPGSSTRPPRSSKPSPSSPAPSTNPSASSPRSPRSSTASPPTPSPSAAASPSPPTSTSATTATPPAARPALWGATVADITDALRARPERSRVPRLSTAAGEPVWGTASACWRSGSCGGLLLREFETWTLRPSWPERMMPAGPLCPRARSLVWEEAGLEKSG